MGGSEDALTLVLMAGMAMVVLAVVLVRPHYALFVYGVALGVPDVAIPIGNITRVRFDDLVVLILCLMLPLMRSKVSGPAERLLMHWMIYAGACVLSLLAVLASGVQVDWYSVFRLAGTVALLVALVNFANTPARLQWLCRGLFVGAMLLGAQLVIRYQEVVAATEFTRYSAFKGALSFDTWNPNTLGLIALPFSFGAYLGWCLERTRRRRIVWLIGAAVFAAVPVFTLARGASIAMLAGWLTCLLIMRTVRLSMLLPLAGLVMFGYLWLFVYSPDLGASAMSIDLDTGRGFSGRFVMWSTALDLFLERPLIGWGFSREVFRFREQIGKGMAHSAYLSVLVEMGILGFLVFLNAVTRTVWGVWRIPATDHRATSIRAGMIGLMVAMVVVGISSTGIGWVKPGILSISLAIICVRLSQPTRPARAVPSTATVR